MLKMRKNLVIVTIILMVCLLGAMTLKVQATGIDNPVNLTGDLDIITGGDDLNSTNNTTMLLPETNTTNTTGNEPVNNTASIIQPVVDNNSTENGTGNTLPKTGVTEDITVMFFIVVCVVSAIYAYKKIRDYNI